MPWSLGATSFDLELRDGVPVLFESGAEPLAHDYDVAGLRRRLESGRFQLIALSRFDSGTVGELVGFDGTRLLVGLTPHRAPRFLSFAWFRRLLR